MTEHSASVRAVQRLPSGRHGLPRDLVVSNQRDRILGGVMSAVSRHGYALTRVEDVIALAGVSRRTFYDHYANKEQAFVEAYDLVVAQLRDGVAGAYATRGPGGAPGGRGPAPAPAPLTAQRDTQDR